MRLVRDPDHRNLCPGGSVVTIGNFDGLHRGHQALLDEVARLADEIGAQQAVVTFEPLSREYFAADTAPPRIHSAAERIRALMRAGVDVAWFLRFNERLARMSATEFVETVLVRGLNAKRVVVGPDFRFGRGREGDVKLLRRLGIEHGFDVVEAPTVTVDGERVSSTRVRQALAVGDFEGTEALLGRPFCIHGRVIRGNALGRRLGYPTANIRLHRRQPPVHGIFAVTVNGPGLDGHLGVASLGSRPTVAGNGETLLEVHLFDFEGDLYGEHLEVCFVAKLRDEEKFETVDDMIDQMDRDAARARALLAA